MTSIQSLRVKALYIELFIISSYRRAMILGCMLRLVQLQVILKKQLYNLC